MNLTKRSTKTANETTAPASAGGGIGGQVKEFAMYPRPFEDEFLLGYIGRLASANGLDFTSVLKDLRLTSGEDFICFKNRVNGPEYWIDSFSEVLNCTSVKYKIVRIARPKHCPACLETHGYWRHIWNYQLYGFCAAHQIQLIDTCHQCQARLDTGSYAGIICRHCCALFENAPYRTAPSPLEIQFSDFFKKKVFGSSFPETENFYALGPQDIHAVVFGLAVMMYESRVQNRPVHKFVSAEDYPYVCSIAAKIVLLWPQPFVDHLEDRRLACNDSWHFARCYNRLHYLLYRKLFTENYNFVRTEFESYLAHNWQGPLTGRSRSLSNDLLRRHPWKSFKETLRSVKISSSKLKSLIADGTVAAASLPHASGKVSTIIHQDSIVVAADVLTRIKNLKESSLYLGISEVRLKVLISCKIITLVKDHKRASTPWDIDCESFLTKFKLKPIKHSTTELMTIGSVIRRSLRCDRKLIRFISALISGSITLYARDGDKFSNYLLLERDYKAWAAQYASFADAEQDCDAGRAAEKLGVKPEVVVQLVHIGLLNSHADRPYHYKIFKEELDVFQSRYVLNTQLARKHLTSPKRISSVLVKHFEPAASPHHETRPCRQYVWYRSDNLDEVLMRSHSAPRPRRARP